MKAVVYHADSHFAWGVPVGDVYFRLFQRFLKMCHMHDIQVVHLTLDGFPGWGDENIHYPGLKAEEMMYNRELLFYDYLSNAPEGVYWFTEPDYNIFNMWPPLTSDCALLYRHGDKVQMCPAWRLATKDALPLFKEFADEIKKFKPSPGVGRDWHCDSEVFNAIWKKMGKPKERTNYLGVEIEFRTYADYIKPGKYGKNYNGPVKKDELLKMPI